MAEPLIRGFSLFVSFATVSFAAAFICFYLMDKTFVILIYLRIKKLYHNKTNLINAMLYHI